MDNLAMRIFKYLLLGILTIVTPYAMTMMLIVITGDRYEGMKLAVAPALISAQLIFGLIFIKSPWSTKTSIIAVATATAYGLVLLITKSELIKTNVDSYGFWDLAVTNFIAGLITWEIFYHVVPVIKDKFKPPILRIVGLTLIIGGGLYFLFIISLAFLPDVSNYFSRTDFDSGKWKNWEMAEDTMSLRWDMVDDLQNDYKLDGMTEEEVIKLLGEPESKSKGEWEYYLGMARRGIDTGTLSLTFENGKVTTHHVRAG
jgi:hypothetical protein